MFKLFWIILTFHFTNCNKVCYNGLGCFNDEHPFSGAAYRPTSLLPESPEKISVKFYLYNRQIASNQTEFISHDKLNEKFDSSLNTKFIIHGFIHLPKKNWVLIMKDLMLQTENLNVIFVDWTKGNWFPYQQAAANSLLVGAEIARLINTIIKEKNSDASRFHLIGHSLGAHIAGYAGSRIPNLGRITGLEPAGPLFKHTDPIVRLDPSDASYVDVIHSDSAENNGLGVAEAVGHSDFYPNGGKNQPGCTANPENILQEMNVVDLPRKEAERIFSCNHMAALAFFIDSIMNVCKYTAFKCNALEEFEKGTCLKCPPSGCNRMGYWSDKSKETGTLFLNTQPIQKLASFCQQHYLVTLVSNSENVTNLSRAKGKFEIYFEADNQFSETKLFDNSNIIFKSDSIETKLISIDNHLNNQITSVYISYEISSGFFDSWLYDDTWSFRKVTIFDGDNQKTIEYCPVEIVFDDKKHGKFVQC